MGLPGVLAMRCRTYRNSGPRWKPGSSPGTEDRASLNCLSFLFSVAVISHPDKSRVRQKEPIWLTIPVYSPSSQGQSNRNRKLRSHHIRSQEQRAVS